MLFNKDKKERRFIARIAIFALLPLFSMQANADQVDEFIAEVMQSKHILGLQLAVVKQGKTVKLASYGSTDPNTQVGVTQASLFPINSMTKAFTGVLIVQLQESNKLRLSDPIGLHLDDLPVTWQSITISQILSHTSGLPSILTGNLVELVGDGTDEGAWQQVQLAPMRSQPDTEFSYNQTGYAVLGKIIEKYSGQRFADTVKSLLLDAGMTKTATYSFQTTHPSSVSKQFVATDDGYQTLSLTFPALLWPAAGMVSNAEELARFTVALQNEAFFTSAQLDALWRPRMLNDGQTAGFNKRENGYAAGWQVITRDEHPAVSASGGNAVTLILYPQEALSVIVLTNVLGSLPIEFVDTIAGFYR